MCEENSHIPLKLPFNDMTGPLDEDITVHDQIKVILAAINRNKDYVIEAFYDCNAGTLSDTQRVNLEHICIDAYETERKRFERGEC